MEVVSDLVLQVYAVMLITAFIDYTNEYGLREITNLVHSGFTPSDAVSRILLMFTFLLVGAIMPIRIADWIEDSLLAFTIREKIGQLVLVAIVTAFLFVPGYVEFKLHFGNLSESVHAFVSSIWMNLILSIAFLMVVMSVRAYFFRPRY